MHAVIVAPFTTQNIEYSMVHKTFQIMQILRNIYNTENSE